ncbi:MAG: hypothetical protein NC124_06920 [Clostridium sp.]|nr:hypothetical protein [Clostridium sp.]
MMDRQVITWKCKQCGKEIPFVHQHRAETLIVLCPDCGCYVEASSCYGFGPVWPACIYNGDVLVAVFDKVGKDSGDQFELRVFDQVMSFVLYDELRINNYKKHFEICKLIVSYLRVNHII